MARLVRFLLFRTLALPLLVVASACVWIFQGVQVTALDRPADSVTVVTPVKAHLVDGSTVVYPDGVKLARDTIWGTGTRYNLALHDSGTVEGLPLDSVLGMETFRTKVNVAPTIVVSTLATAPVAIMVGVAIILSTSSWSIGSCPTFYSDSAGVFVLEAEGFSYSVAPLFEARDVDRLRLHAAADGTVRLEVRNEAFETHYINHLELLEVRHGAEELALPDERNRPLVVRELAVPARARDRAGRDVRHVLIAADGAVYRTDERVLAGAEPSDLDDEIELAVAAPPGADSVALVLRQRNSLLNTILFYDIMLGDPGARSLDWVGRDLEQIGPAVALAAWYQKRMGMRIAVRDGGAYRELARLKDAGPVAWKDVAVVLPVLEPDSVRIRLSFPADNWRIDRVAVAARFQRPTPLVHPLAAVLDARDDADTTALASLVAADGRYLETSAGHRFAAEFRAGAAPLGGNNARTFFLASQGYYTEWVRRGWLAAPRATTTFTPSDSALYEAIARWRVTQDTLEARFMATRVPVR